MEGHEQPPPLLEFSVENPQHLECVEHVEFLSEDSQSCDGTELGKRHRGFVDPNLAARKKDRREAYIFLKEISISGETRISCGQWVRLEVGLAHPEFGGKYSLEPYQAKGKHFANRQLLLFLICPESLVDTWQDHLLAIELWFKHNKDTNTEKRIDDFCASCKKKSVKKKIVSSKEEKVSGTFGEKVPLDIQINEQCAHFVDKYGGPANSQFFLHTILYVKDRKERKWVPIQNQLSNGILVIAAGKADSGIKKKNQETSNQTAQFLNDFALKFDTQIKKLSSKVDSIDTRLQAVESSVRFLLGNNNKMEFPPAPMTPQQQHHTLVAPSTTEFKFQKFGACFRSPGASIASSPAWTGPAVPNLPEGVEAPPSENSLANWKLTEIPNANSLDGFGTKTTVPIKQDPDLANYVGSLLFDQNSNSALFWPTHFPM